MMEYAKAFEIAQRLITRWEPDCERISVAGSLRRGNAEVKDIEIVAMPRASVTNTLFGYDVVPQRLHTEGVGHHVKNGEKYKQIVLPEEIMLDLFIVTPPAQWGVILALRTGPAELSKKLVTPRRFGGFMPSWAKPKDGAVWAKGKIIPMPEERDLFEFCGLTYYKPDYRSVLLRRLHG